MATESELKRRRDELVRVRKNIATESDKFAKETKKASDLRLAASKTNNASVARSKLSQADAADKRANSANKKRAELESKAATLEGKIARATVDVEKRRAADQKKALDEMETRTRRAAQQFSPTLSGLRASQPLPVVQPSTPDNDLVETHDVFLSHASEDKDEIARPLKDALEARGISVWFDEMNIRVGQSIRQEIERGITHARFGVVIVSPHFLKKKWTNAELSAMFNRKMDSGQDDILPVWHKVTKDEISQDAPFLLDTLALNSAIQSVDEMADMLAELVRDSKGE